MLRLLRVHFKIIFNKYSSLSIRICVENVENYDYLLVVVFVGKEVDEKIKRINNKLRITAWYFKKENFSLTDFSKDFHYFCCCYRNVVVLLKSSLFNC